MLVSRKPAAQQLKNTKIIIGTFLQNISVSSVLIRAQKQKEFTRETQINAQYVHNATPWTLHEMRATEQSNAAG